MVARGVGWGRVSPKCQRDEQDAGDHKGPPNPTSATLAPTDVDGLVGRLMRIGRRMAILCYKKVLQIIFSITAMDDHVALAFEMRHFASDSFREVPGFLHCVLADN